MVDDDILIPEPTMLAFDTADVIEFPHPPNIDEYTPHALFKNPPPIVEYLADAELRYPPLIVENLFET